MILDQTIGVHRAQAEYLSLGDAWTWVSGDSQEVGTTTSLTFLAGLRPALEFESGQRSALDFSGGLR